MSKTYERLKRTVALWEGINAAVGEDLLGKKFWVYYDEEVWTKRELRKRLERITQKPVELVPEKHREEHEHE